MPPSPLTRRVEILEKKVERLERLPARIDNLEVSARIAEGDEETRRYMRALHEEVIARFATIGEGRRQRE